MKRIALLGLLITSFIIFFACSTVDNEGDDGTDPGTIVDGLPTGNWITSSFSDTGGVAQVLTIYDKTILSFNGSQVIIREFDDSDSTIHSDTVTFEFNNTFDTITIDSMYTMAMKVIGTTIVESGNMGTTIYMPYEGEIPPIEWDFSSPIDTTDSVTYPIPTELTQKNWAMISMKTEKWVNGTITDSSLLEMIPETGAYLTALLFQMTTDGLLQYMNAPDYDTYVLDTMDLSMVAVDTIMIDEGKYVYSLIGDTLTMTGGNSYGDTTEVDTIILVLYTGTFPPASWTTGKTVPAFAGTWEGTMTEDTITMDMVFSFELDNSYEIIAFIDTMGQTIEFPFDSGDWTNQGANLTLYSDGGDTTYAKQTVTGDSLVITVDTMTVNLIKK